MTAENAAEPRATHVIEALCRVMRDLPSIEKGGTAAAAQGGYAYRGIDQITPHTQELFARHCVLFAPRVVSYELRDLIVAGKPWTDVIEQVEYDVYGPGGIADKIVIGPILAIGRDNSDKGGNKCLTQAMKYALLQAFQISDPKDDADGQTHEADGRDAAPPDPTKVRASAETLAEFHRAKDALSEMQRAALKKWFEQEHVPPVDKASEAHVIAATAAARGLQTTTQEGAGVDAPPAESAPSRKREAIGKKDVGALADVVFLGDAAKAKPGKKTDAKRAIRYALTHALTDGKAQSLDDLDGDGLHRVYDALLSIQAGVTGIAVDFDPEAGVSFAWADGETTVVLWSELSVGAPA